MQQLLQMPLQSSQNQAPDQNQLYWTPIRISLAGKSLTFRSLEKFLRNTPGCAATIPRFPIFCLLPPAFSTWSPMNRKLMPTLDAATSFAQSYRHGYILLLLFLLLKGEAKIAHGTCNAKIPGAFWPASGMVLYMKLFPGSPVDLGNGKLSLSK